MEFNKFKNSSKNTENHEEDAARRRDSEKKFIAKEIYSQTIILKHN
jgi:hypothetical protein